MKIILAGLFLFSVLGSIPGSDRYGLAGGYSVLWLLMMYLVGAYLKLHGYPHLKNVVYLGIYFLASLANLLISDSLSWVKVRFLHGDDKLFLGVVIAYTNPLLVLEVVCLFIWLLRFPIKSLWLQKSLLSLSPLAPIFYKPTLSSTPSSRELIHG